MITVRLYGRGEKSLAKYLGMSLRQVQRWRSGHNGVERLPTGRDALGGLVWDEDEVLGWCARVGLAKRVVHADVVRRVLAELGAFDADASGAQQKSAGADAASSLPATASARSNDDEDKT